MNKRLLVALVLTLALFGCANKPLEHNYVGDVNVRTLHVELAPIREPENGLNENLSTITKIVKGVQEILDVFDPQQRELLIQQLHDFETILTTGIKTKTNIPVVVPADSEVKMQYGDHAELVDIDYQYPLSDGPYLNLFVTIYYTQRSDLAIGSKEFNQQYIELVPEIILQIDGYNAKNELFWRESFRYESTERFTFGDNYVLGVPTDRLRESQIFLVPLAQGVIDNMLPQVNHD